jgi:hypothetical protein
MAGLVHSDFKKAADTFFGHIQSLRALRDEIVERPFHTAAGIDAMVLSYLIDTDISAKNIDAYAQLNPCQMTEEFTAYFKKEIGLTEKA